MFCEPNDPSIVFPPVALPAPRSAFRLAQDILIDFEAYEYEVRGKRVPMPLRESRLLAALVKKCLTAPRGFVSVDFLADLLLSRYTDYLDPGQAVSQVVTGIRKSWGETPYRPRYLISARYKGYQLRPEPGFGYVVPFCSEKPE